MLWWFLTLLSLTHFHTLSTILQVFVNAELHVSTDSGHHQVHSNCTQATERLRCQ
jgi:hypothetical protein